MAQVPTWCLFLLQRNCSNCGNSFCSRCCSYKVLRSCMGATGERQGGVYLHVFTKFAWLPYRVTAATYFPVSLTPAFIFSLSLLVSPLAPEAQRETVFVCAACNSSLIKLQWNGVTSVHLISQWPVGGCSLIAPHPWLHQAPATCINALVFK